MSRTHDTCTAPSLLTPEQAPPAMLPERPNTLAGFMPIEPSTGRNDALAALADEPLGDFYYESFIADPETTGREALFTAYFGDWAGFERLLCAVYTASEAEAAAGSKRADTLRGLRARIEAGLDAMRADPSPFELDIVAGQLGPQVQATALFLRAAFGPTLEQLVAGLVSRDEEAARALHGALGADGPTVDIFDSAADLFLRNMGFGLQSASNSLMGMGDPLLDCIDSDAFNEGRQTAHLFDMIKGAAEMALGAGLLGGAATTTAGGLAVTAGSGGALALPAGGLVVVVDGVLVTVGSLLILHGGASMMNGYNKRNQANDAQSSQNPSAKSGRIPAPRLLTAFPEAVRVGARNGRARWKDANFLYEWDSLHGTIERYNKRGIHLGEYADRLENGQPVRLSDAVKGRRIDP